LNWQQRSGEWEAKHIANASYFTAALFLGSGRWDKRRAESLDEARLLAQQMHQENSNNYGRKVLIYAIPHGIELSILVETV
jgi:hypothetical protein